jgi:ATP-binding cassette subfamily B protein
VCFRYDDDSDNVLDHVSFVAPAGKTCALVGSTGSGKSTVLKLIERFQDVSSGRVTVDGVDVRDIPQETLHSLFGYVPQKAFLFSGTVKSNLDYAGSISDERRQMALDVSQAAEFVDGKLGGLQAEIAQGGTNVSGGQRQRLAIARAIAVDARGYLFDDSFSALDYKTDAALRKGLKTRLAGSTVLIVAQRIATIMNADHIVVLDEGRVVGQGTHDELLHTCREYREIALSQFSPEELFGPKVPETVLDEVAEGGDDDGC